MSGRTLAEKIWRDHLVKKGENGQPDLIYIDLHLLHEVTSPQAFGGLRAARRRVRRPDLTVATEDHNVPTAGIVTGATSEISDLVARTQVKELRRNCAEFGVPIFPMGNAQQGIVHVVGPQLGLTQPGMTVVCGDSHTATHGALGAIAFGIGTSEVEHVLATQTLAIHPFRTMSITVTGTLQDGVTAKDLILSIIARIGSGGGQGHIIEYRGEAIRHLSMEARMTVCNMSIEAGARAGLIAPDEKTFAYLKDKPHAPTGHQWDRAVQYWRSLATDADATFDKDIVIDGTKIEPFVTWGTNPSQGTALSKTVPDPALMADADERLAAEKALAYMGLEPGTPMKNIPINTVFVGSCTNGRIEDLRTVAAILSGRTVNPAVRMLIVPGSRQVAAQAEKEELDKIFLAAGADWRLPGCSLCLAMNPDKLEPGERAASTSNRNFEGRQGPGSRTHLVSPAVAAATAIAGHLAGPADLPVGAVK